MIRCTDVYSAILEDYVVLDADIWKNARHYFSQYKSSFGEHVLLPVVDKMGQLVCFAYEDSDANREIRMLRELSELSCALQFADIFSEYRCVKIYEFNELAYYFAKYLEGQNIAVQVIGTMWQDYFTGTDCQVPDYECLTIYAEGVGEKKRNWVENLLRSVSVEFECIDVVYEANIKAGIIRDAIGDCASLMERLKGEKEIIIIGAGREAQDAYDLLVENGIDICCFVDERQQEQKHRLFGKKILSSLNARNIYKNPIFLECVSENSAWGMGGVDYYDYIGYRRNKRFFLLRDYVDDFESGLIHALKNRKIVLVGDICLCNRLIAHFRNINLSEKGEIVYWDILGRESECGLGTFVESIKNENEETIYLIVVPEYCDPETLQQQKIQKKAIIECMRKMMIDNYSDYFSYMLSFIDVEEKNDEKYTIHKQLMPKRIVLGSIESCSGNIFFRGLLDNHPCILMIDYSDLNSNLFWLCVRLSMEESENILSQFWKLYQNEGGKLYRPEAFNEKMEELLACGRKFTSQELFVMFHIAYMHMYERNVADISDMIIYWEPHHMNRVIVEECVKWLGAEKMPCDIVNVVRNLCMRNGSALKGYEIMGWGERKNPGNIWYVALYHPSIKKRDYKWCKRLVVRFEDLKLYAEEILSDICKKWGIAWSDTIMCTTHNGKKSAYDNGDHLVSDFDLSAVYNTYEKYFSEYDRFRIMLINAPWQRKYGYPYVEVTRFSKRELQEMFSKPFRFEELLEYNGEKAELSFRIKLQNSIRSRLQEARMIEMTSNE